MRVRYDDRAIAQLSRIRQWIAQRAGEDVADRIVESIFSRCEALSSFPERGTPHPDLHPRLRTIPHRGRYTIGYVVGEDTVTIVGIRSAGQDLDALIDD